MPRLPTGYSFTQALVDAGIELPPETSGVAILAHVDSALQLQITIDVDIDDVPKIAKAIAAFSAHALEEQLAYERQRAAEFKRYERPESES